MKFALLTNIVSPHQLPLANELVSLLGAGNYRYYYTNEVSSERQKIGWGAGVSAEWCTHVNVCADELKEVEVLMSGIRALDLFEYRASENKKTIYCSERWFKPFWGFFRMLVPSYFLMAYRVARLLRKDKNFLYFPMGIHAARDMARLCGLMNWDFRCLFRAPRLEFERCPGGRIWLEGELQNAQKTRKYCLDKMRMWGYFVEPSKHGEGSSLCANNADELKILWVGRLLNLKRVDSIIKAVGECEKMNSCVKISVDIYGLGPEEQKLRKLAARYGDVIKFYPPVPIGEVRQLMREHDVYVLASDGHEGWGAVVSEALEEGMKVIGTYEAGSSATILPESNLYHAGDWLRLKNILEWGQYKTVKFYWSARKAKEVIKCICLV